MRQSQPTTNLPPALPRYIAYAAALHAAFVLGSLNSCRANGVGETSAHTPTPEEWVAIDPPPAPPPEPPRQPTPVAGGRELPSPPSAARAKSVIPAKTTMAKIAKPALEDETETEESDAGPEGDAALAGSEEGDAGLPAADALPEPAPKAPAEPEFDAVAAALARRQRDFKEGTGYGTNGGPGGFGAGWGSKAIPMVHGEFPFGGGVGALKGVVCFIPEETQRLADVKTCEPVAAFYTNELNIPTRTFTAGFPGIDNRFEWFAIDYQGAFRVSRAGEYGFRLLSDDGSYLYIDGKQVIDNDGMHGPRANMPAST